MPWPAGDAVAEVVGGGVSVGLPVGGAVVVDVGGSGLLDEGDALGLGVGVGEDDRVGVTDGGGGSVGEDEGARLGDNDGLGEREGGAIDGVLLGLNPEMLEIGPPPPAHDAATSTRSAGTADRRKDLTSVSAPESGQQVEHFQVEPDDGGEQAPGRIPPHVRGGAAFDTLIDDREVDE